LRLRDQNSKWKYGDKESGISKWRAEFEMEDKKKLQEDNGIKFGMSVEGSRGWVDGVYCSS
jgi:hypothetical protein